MNTTPTAPELLGFEPGAPAHIRPATLQIDAQVAEHMRCRACRQRGLSFAAYHRGRLYAPVAVCPRCGTQEAL